MYIDESKITESPEERERRLDCIARNFQKVLPKHIDIDLLRELEEDEEGAEVKQGQNGEKV